MARLHRARVCYFGTEKDMMKLCRVLLKNCDWLEEPEDGPALTLDGLLREIHERAADMGAGEKGFFYGMVARYTMGDSDDDKNRLDIMKHPAGLWTACFSYEGEVAFQPEDWLDLHERTGRVPALAIHAEELFGPDLGMTVFTGGKAMDEWSFMGETWLWLMEQYMIGYPPEEAVRRLDEIERLMADSEYEMTVDELLEMSIDHLKDILAHTSQPEMLRSLMDQCLKSRDYSGLFMVQCQVAETVLWDCAREKRWLAHLQSVRMAWQEKYPRSEWPEKYAQDEDE